MAIDLENLKANLSTATSEHTVEPPPVEPEPTAPAPSAPATSGAQKYQHYKSARVSTRLITTEGKLITFTNYQFITCDQDCIAYLDTEIDAGIKYITKGELLTHEEADPMVALRRKIIAEHEAAKKLAAGPGAYDTPMGNTKDTPNMNVLTSEEVAN